MDSQFLRAFKPGPGQLAVGLLAVVVAALSLALAGIRSGADAEEARSTTKVELGKTGKMPKPACPKDCDVVASVSGFQVETRQVKSPFKAPFDGTLTHFTLYLGKPNYEDRQSLNDAFGDPPQAAITVLKKVRTASGSEKFRLLRKSPVEGLNKYLGKKRGVRIKLTTPLEVGKGNFVALAVPTWAPVFTLTEKKAGPNRWRASRQPGKCGGGFLQQSAPQLKVDSNRFYACKFKDARLLYTATLVRTPAGENQ